jgi:hypothetical protein
MDQKEFDNLKKALSAYRDKKEEVLEPLYSYKERCASRGQIPVHEDEIARDVYFLLYDTPERKIFSELAERTEKDAEFEKYFRSAFSSVFQGRDIDPKTL